MITPQTPKAAVRTCARCERPTRSELDPPECYRCQPASWRRRKAGGRSARRSPLHPDPVLCGLATPERIAELAARAAATPERIAELAARAAATPPLPLFPNRRQSA